MKMATGSRNRSDLITPQYSLDKYPDGTAPIPWPTASRPG